MRHPISRVLRAAVALASFALLSSTPNLVARAKSASAELDCHRAATPQEKAICAAPKLKGLDDWSTRVFQLVRDGSKPAVRRALLKIQRSWLAHRDAGCPTAERSCLLAAYQQHHDWLDALSNRLSEDAPLGDLKAYALRGRWSVQPVADPDGHGQPLPPDLQRSMIFDHMLWAGTVVSGKGAQTCYADNCWNIGWEAQPLASFDELYGKGWSAKLPPDTPAYVILLSGKAEFYLVQTSPATLAANVGICDMRENCRGGYQTWRAASPDAKLVALAP